MKYSFSINMYDYEGDEFDCCILAHCGENTILRFENVKELEEFAESMLGSLEEIRENL